MKTKKVPVRMCIACKESRPKKELVRIVATDEGLYPDETGKAHGRGAYVCPSLECLDRAVRIKAFERSLDATMSEKSYNAIKRVILRRDIK